EQSGDAPRRGLRGAEAIDGGEDDPPCGGQTSPRPLVTHRQERGGNASDQRVLLPDHTRCLLRSRPGSTSGGNLCFGSANASSWSVARWCQCRRVLWRIGEHVRRSTDRRRPHEDTGIEASVERLSL